MTAGNPSFCYALGSTDAEQERLIWQAARLAASTERLFRDAGIGPGQRLLDLGSGVGDVAILAARLVGPSGEVLGIERDSRAIARAEIRVAAAGLRNVCFTQCDVSQIESDKPFDAAVGRFILQFIPDPVAVLRSVSQFIRPGGVVAFQEVSYAPLRLFSAHLPLWSASVSIIQETLKRAGANTEMGFALHRVFQEAGFAAPAMLLELQLGSGPDFTQWIYDLLCSLRPQIHQHNLSLEPLGDFDTLPTRLQTEVATSKSVAPFIALVGAWSRKPI